MTETTAAPAREREQTPEEIEREWFENVYQGDRQKQLTVRAIVMGIILAMIMVCSNIYVGLRAGWGMGVAITSCVLAFAAFRLVSGTIGPLMIKAHGVPVIGPFFRWIWPDNDFSLLENNALQSTASAGGLMTGTGLTSAIPALMMLNVAALPTSFTARCMWLIPWVATIGGLGVFLAVPAKRQMINIEKLPFPTGTAAARTLSTLHAEGAEASRQAGVLGLAGLFGMVVTWLRDGGNLAMMQVSPIAGAPAWAPIKALFSPKALPWFRLPRIESTWGTAWVKLGMYRDQPLGLNQVTMSFEGSLLFVAAGAIMGFRQAWSLMLGAVINYVVLAPHFLRAGDIKTASFRGISTWSLWIGVPMMVTSGLLLFFMNWKSVARAFGTLTAFLSRKAPAKDPMADIEVPGSWFITGFCILGLSAIVLAHQLFHVQYWMGAVAVLATFFLVVVAARAVGETDVTPTGPLSKITQLTFGALAPGNITTNLMTANISAGACSQAGELLTDLKSGYLLGANPRRQFIAQLIGMLAGSLMVVPVYFILIPTPDLLGTEKWPAPAARVWRGVAELLSKGVHALPPSAQVGLLIGGLIGIIIPLLELRFPRAKKFIPSATGLGLAFTINGYNSISFFIGACLVLWFSKSRPKLHEKYTVPVASGIIAGESLMGVAIALITALPNLLATLHG